MFTPHLHTPGHTSQRSASTSPDAATLSGLTFHTSYISLESNPSQSAPSQQQQGVHSNTLTLGTNLTQYHPFTTPVEGDMISTTHVPQPVSNGHPARCCRLASAPRLHHPYNPPCVRLTPHAVARATRLLPSTPQTFKLETASPFGWPTSRHSRPTLHLPHPASPTCPPALNSRPQRRVEAYYLIASRAQRQAPPGQANATIHSPPITLPKPPPRVRPIAHPKAK